MKIKDSKGVVTNEKLYEAVDAILVGMDHMSKEQEKKNQERHSEIKQELDKLSKKVDVNNASLQDQIENQALDTVSRREFEALKSKVNKLALQ
ncbi:MAG: hypothetical protein US96_C0007G0007 [Candidatus Woesebacteria bacterium GW2011_GWB1_38_5b]|uniref:Uncharacterized protein n=1 Tax=Candidatus Woesebacteria bacterium GW2011_GWB1_38_5b TaxID=1618569 RepID=A0A0G0MPS8_9BACT|nr:MAG: hypothetical protein US96_C0007G0007 [Candidatus Woesebacteria bacterium GW2011_GWB1_38_5b]